MNRLPCQRSGYPPTGSFVLAWQGSLVETLREVRPTAFMGVPRVWEKMQEQMKSVGAKSSMLKKKIAVWAKAVGLETNLKRMNGYEAGGEGGGGGGVLRCLDAAPG